MSTVDDTDLTQPAPRPSSSISIGAARRRRSRPRPLSSSRIEKVNPEINAFCLVDADAALASARGSEARWQRGEPIGPLDGVPTSIKDLILTRGWPTRRGSFTVDPDQPWDVDAPADGPAS